MSARSPLGARDWRRPGRPVGVVDAAVGAALLIPLLQEGAAFFLLLLVGGLAALAWAAPRAPTGVAQTGSIACLGVVVVGALTVALVVRQPPAHDALTLAWQPDGRLTLWRAGGMIETIVDARSGAHIASAPADIFPPMHHLLAGELAFARATPFAPGHVWRRAGRRSIAPWSGGPVSPGARYVAGFEREQRQERLVVWATRPGERTRNALPSPARATRPLAFLGPDSARLFYAHDRPAAESDGDDGLHRDALSVVGWRTATLERSVALPPGWLALDAAPAGDGRVALACAIGAHHDVVTQIRTSGRWGAEQVVIVVVDPLRDGAAEIAARPLLRLGPAKIGARSSGMLLAADARGALINLTPRQAGSRRARLRRLTWATGEVREERPPGERWTYSADGARVAYLEGRRIHVAERDATRSFPLPWTRDEQLGLWFAYVACVLAGAAWWMGERGPAWPATTAALAVSVAQLALALAAAYGRVLLPDWVAPTQVALQLALLAALRVLPAQLVGWFTLAGLLAGGGW